MKRKAITFLWMSISCLLAFTVLSLGYAESEISSADSASVFFSVIDEFRAAIHDPHYDSSAEFISLTIYNTIETSSIIG